MFFSSHFAILPFFARESEELIAQDQESGRIKLNIWEFGEGSF